MKSALQTLAGLCGIKSISFGLVEIAQLFGETHYEIHPAVHEYFSKGVPSVTIDTEVFRILSAAAIIDQNTGYIPSYFTAPHGFVTFALDSCGDAFSIDVTNGEVLRLSHEKYENDGIHPGWNADCSDFLPVLPVTRQNIIDTSEGYFPTIDLFLADCLDIATEQQT